MPQVTLFEHQQVGWEELGWTEDSPYPDLLESLNESVGDSLIVLGHKTLKATQYVGVIRLFDLTIQILPKIDFEALGNSEADPGSSPRESAETSAMTNLLHMLSYAEDLSIKEETITSLETVRDDWFELLTRFYATELHKQILQGAFRTYIHQEDCLPVLRGKWLISRQATRRSHQHHLFEIAFDDFTIDTPLNQMFRYVTERLLSLTHDPVNRRLLKVIRNCLIDVTCLGKTDQALLHQIHFDRLNQRFYTAYCLAQLFLQQESILLASGNRQVFAFVFDMNRLFEQFVAGFLVKYKRRIFSNITEDLRINFQSRGDRVYLLQREPDEKPQLRLHPDILFSSIFGQYQLIIDTKYKRYDTSVGQRSIAESDVYQMVAYMTRFHCPRSLLLYPGSHRANEQGVNYRILETNQRIYTTSINLRQPLRNPEPLIETFQQIFNFVNFPAYMEDNHGS